MLACLHSSEFQSQVFDVVGLRVQRVRHYETSELALQRFDVAVPHRVRTRTTGKIDHANFVALFNKVRAIAKGGCGRTMSG